MEYGLIGEKLTHSFSPEIHKILGNRDYGLIELPENKLQDFINTKHFKGINVTIPYKKKVIPLLDYVDPVALKIGAVNTILNDHGVLKGFNTDTLGLLYLLNANKINIRDKIVLVLGTGGTSNTAYTVCKELNAKKIIKVSRTKTQNVIDYDVAVQKYSNSVSCIINTTPCGMYPNINATPIDVKSFTKLESVVDVIYNPLQTELLMQAKDLGLKAVGGLYMLVAQAVYSSEYFLSKKYQRVTIHELCENMIKKKYNVVLTGMPGSGKTSVGKALAKKLNKKFIDIDDEIQKQKGLSPGEYINIYGEEAFRNKESQIISQVALNNGIVIATGGGSVLKSENVKELKRNGRLYFLNRSLDKLIPTEDRPLSNSYDSLLDLYKKRFSIYQGTADVIIPNDLTVEKTVQTLYENITNITNITR